MDSSLLNSETHSRVYKDYGSNEFSGLIVPLLIELGWTKDEGILRLALPERGTNLDITSFLNIMAKIYYGCDEYFQPISELTHLELPFLYLPDGEPGFVVTKISENSDVEVINPDNEKITLKLNKIAKGRALSFIHIDKEVKLKSLKQNWILDKVYKFRNTGYVLLFLSGIIVFSGMSNTLFIITAYDSIIPTGNVELVIKYFIGMIVVGTATYFLKKLRSKIVIFNASRLDKIIGMKMINQILYLPISFNENTSFGSRVSVIDEFSSLKEFMISKNAVSVFEMPFVMIALGIVVYLIGWLALAPFLLVILYFILIAMMKPIINYYSVQSMQVNRDWKEFEIDTLDKIREVKLCGLSKNWIERYNEYLLSSLSLSTKVMSLSTIGHTTFESIFKLSGLLVVCFGAMEVINGNLSTGALIGCMMIIWAILQPLQSLVSILPRLASLRVTYRQLAYVVDLETEQNPYVNLEPHLEGNLPKLSHPYSVTLQNIVYQYKQSKNPVLNDLSFKVDRGEFVCLMGNDGAGKTTIMKLITKLYELQRGEIYIEHFNLKQINSYDVRENVAYLPENPQLIAGTVEELLFMFNPNATYEELVKVTKLLQIEKEISQLENGFKTYMSEQMAHRFSDFFIYRLYLAGLLLKKPKILLINQPTCSVSDDETGHLIEVMHILKKHMTIIVSTQNPLYLGSCDKIMQIKQGKIIISGHPHKVLSQLSFGSV